MNNSKLVNIVTTEIINLEEFYYKTRSENTAEQNREILDLVAKMTKMVTLLNG